MSFLKNKRILITGMISNRSISYGIAKAMHREGAELSFTYQSNKLQARVKKLSNKFNSKIILPCDVSTNKNIKKLFINLSNFWKKFDGFVHSIAYAPSKELKGDYLTNVTRKGFLTAHNISSYSFAAMAKFSRNMLNPNSSLITLTYLGSKKVIPNYNVMGIAKASLEANTRYMAASMGRQNIRVNAISAGPIKTLASSKIKDFKKIISFYNDMRLTYKSISIEDIGNVAAFLCSNLASGITGETINVDGGFNITTMNKFILN